MTHPLKLVWRFASGQAMDGQLRTDATFTRRSTTTLGPRPVWKWHHLPERHRAAIRLAAAAVVVGGLVGWSTAPIPTLACAVLAAAGGTWWKVRTWRHNRNWVHPLEAALPPGVTVAELPRDRSRAVLDVPVGSIADDKFKQSIMLAATAKMHPSGELKGDFSKLHGKRPQVVITLVELPPGFVGFSDVQPYADAAAEHEVVFGLGQPTAKYRKGAPVIISVNNDSPHLGISAGSGGSKSVTARNASCQLAHHGALIACLDAKLMSHHWAAGLRNVAYARTPEEIHKLAIWLAGEVDNRNRIALHNADVEGNVHASVGPRIVGILEELNITQAILSAYWKATGGKGRSPAVLALDYVSFSGRAVDVNLVYIGQRLSAKATSGGSGDARENIGVLLMNNPAPSTWKMLVGDRHALPAATDVPGRLQVVTAKTVTEVQGAFPTGAQAREYATSGIVAVPPADMPCVGGLAPVGTPERVAQHVPDMPAIEGQRPDLHVVPNSPGQPPPVLRITIAEAVAEGISGPTEEAVRKALQRSDAPPLPVARRGNADVYDRVAWCDWEEARRQPRRLTR